MTTHELAKLLLEKPNVIVITDGYELGQCEITKVIEVNIELNHWESGGYFGPHDIVNKPTKTSIPAIYLPRNNGEE